MEKYERKVISTSNMTWKLIGWDIVWGILAQIIIQIPIGLLKKITGDNLVMYVILNLVLSAVAGYFVWKISILSAFKKFTVDRMQVQYIIKNLLILTIILSILFCIINVVESRNFSKELENSSEMKMANIMSRYLSKEDRTEYDTTLEKAMRQAQNQVTGYSIVMGIGGIIINAAVLVLNKKNIYIKAVGASQEEENIVDEYKLR